MAQWLGSSSFRQGDASGAGWGCSAALPAEVRGTLHDIGIFRWGGGDQSRDQPSFPTIKRGVSLAVILQNSQYKHTRFHSRGVNAFGRSAEIPFY